jgi:hypothetical protein
MRGLPAVTQLSWTNGTAASHRGGAAQEPGYPDGVSLSSEEYAHFFGAAVPAPSSIRDAREQFAESHALVTPMETVAAPAIFYCDDSFLAGALPSTLPAVPMHGCEAIGGCQGSGFVSRDEDFSLPPDRSGSCPKPTGKAFSPAQILLGVMIGFVAVAALAALGIMVAPGARYQDVPIGPVRSRGPAQPHDIDQQQEPSPSVIAEPAHHKSSGDEKKSGGPRETTAPLKSPTGNSGSFVPPRPLSAPAPAGTLVLQDPPALLQPLDTFPAAPLAPSVALPPAYQATHVHGWYHHPGIGYITLLGGLLSYNEPRLGSHNITLRVSELSFRCAKPQLKCEIRSGFGHSTIRIILKDAMSFDAFLSSLNAAQDGAARGEDDAAR